MEFSASASVLPMNIQDWFPFGWTGLISLQSKRLSRVFSSTAVQKHQFFGAQLYGPTHIHTWLTEKAIALTGWTFVGSTTIFMELFHTLQNAYYTWSLSTKWQWQTASPHAPPHLLQSSMILLISKQPLQEWFLLMLRAIGPYLSYFTQLMLHLLPFFFFLNLAHSFQALSCWRYSIFWHTFVSTW